MVKEIYKLRAFRYDAKKGREDPLKGIKLLMATLKKWVHSRVLKLVDKHVNKNMKI